MAERLKRSELCCKGGLTQDYVLILVLNVVKIVKLV